MAEGLVASILDTLLSNYGYLAVFAVVGMESLGVPVPGETMLVTAAISTPIDIAVGIAAVAAIVWIALLVRRQADRLAAVAEQKYPGPLTER